MSGATAADDPSGPSLSFRRIFGRDTQEKRSGQRRASRPRCATLTVHDGAELVTVRHARAAAPLTGGGERGQIVGLSAASERRLRLMLAKIELDTRSLFVTLTYPADYPPTPERSKRDLSTLAKRVRRRWSEFGAIWFREFTRRGISHFHLLMYGLPVDADGIGLAELRRELRRMWTDVTAIPDADTQAKQRRMGVQVDLLRSERGTRNYLASYFKGNGVKGKGGPKWYQRATVYPAGRWWGVIGRDYVPFATPTITPLSDAAATRLARWTRRITHSRRHAQPTVNVISRDPNMAERWTAAAALAETGESISGGWDRYVTAETLARSRDEKRRSAGSSVGLSTRKKGMAAQRPILVTISADDPTVKGERSERRSRMPLTVGERRVPDPMIRERSTA